MTFKNDTTFKISLGQISSPLHPNIKKVIIFPCMTLKYKAKMCRPITDTNIKPVIAYLSVSCLWQVDPPVLIASSSHVSIQNLHHFGHLYQSLDKYNLKAQLGRSLYLCIRKVCHVFGLTLFFPGCLHHYQSSCFWFILYEEEKHRICCSLHDENLLNVMCFS